LRFNEEAMEAVADVMRLLYQRGLVQVKGGNVSVLDKSSGLVYITPTGVPRHQLKADDIAVMSIDGSVIVGTPSSEFRMHLDIYRSIPSAVSVVHAHPPKVIALYELGSKLDLSMTTEARARVNCVSEVPYVKPGTQELATAVSDALKQCQAAALRGHGIVAYSSRDVYEALDIVEALSDLAEVQLYAGLIARK
jgi:L-fuculose-phosphate aldolase